MAGILYADSMYSERADEDAYRGDKSHRGI